MAHNIPERRCELPFVNHMRTLANKGCHGVRERNVQVLSLVQINDALGMPPRRPGLATPLGTRNLDRPIGREALVNLVVDNAWQISRWRHRHAFPPSPSTAWFSVSIITLI